MVSMKISYQLDCKYFGMADTACDKYCITNCLTCTDANPTPACGSLTTGVGLTASRCVFGRFLATCATTPCGALNCIHCDEATGGTCLIPSYGYSTTNVAITIANCPMLLNGKCGTADTYSVTPTNLCLMANDALAACNICAGGFNFVSAKAVCKPADATKGIYKD